MPCGGFGVMVQSRRLGAENDDDQRLRRFEEGHMWTH